MNSDILVILKAAGAADASRAHSGARVTQSVSDRVFVAQGQITPSSAVERVLTGSESGSDLPADLTPTEKLFVEGWLLSKKPKRRTGEGLDWDAPGFQPPDPPKR